MAEISAPTSARLRFRPAARGDAPLLERHWSEPLVRRYLWDDRPVARETVLAVLAASAADFARAGYGLWILRQQDDTFAGTCGLRPFDGTPHVEVLYSVEPALWKRGLATEAAAACLRFAFERLALPRVLGGVDGPNAASRHVLEKLGMAPFEGSVTAAGGVAYLAVDAAGYLGLSGPVGPGV
jgi:RimJ/RimL family protein N-acetyltransferase